MIVISNNKYTEDSIQKMDPLSFCRHRPDSYLGSNEDSSQLLREIISNASDEFLIGNCFEINIEYDEDEEEYVVFGYMNIDYNNNTYEIELYDSYSGIYEEYPREINEFVYNYRKRL